MMTVDVDVVIVGGGIAGLWLLAVLRAAGYGALLVECNRLGAGQTICSQGIIHGGTKYALQGRISGATRAIGQMPAVWRRCLAGIGEVDLTGVTVLAKHQYLWASSLTSRLAGFFASHAMKSRMERVDPEDYPTVLRHSHFHGQVYRLEEPVLAIASLLKTLADCHRQALLLNDRPVSLNADGTISLHTLQRQPLIVRARRTVLTAGYGNGALSTLSMQIRPLHMVMVRGDSLPDGLYAHCLGSSATPRLTITSHRDSAGRRIWYLGGQLAEAGVKRDTHQQIQAARQELTELLPWVDLSETEFTTLRVDRAEASLGGGRPDTPGVFQNGQIITAWPTKLAMAPLLANKVLELLQRDNLLPQGIDHDRLADWPRPPVAAYPWDEQERRWY
jgi:glycerol-3-phosphate dehydrogenase